MPQDTQSLDKSSKSERYAVDFRRIGFRDNANMSRLDGIGRKSDCLSRAHLLIKSVSRHERNLSKSKFIIVGQRNASVTTLRIVSKLDGNTLITVYEFHAS